MAPRPQRTGRYSIDSIDGGSEQLQIRRNGRSVVFTVRRVDEFLATEDVQDLVVVAWLQSQESVTELVANRRIDLFPHDPDIINERWRGEEYADPRAIELPVLQHSLDAFINGTGIDHAGFYGLRSCWMAASLAVSQVLVGTDSSTLQSRKRHEVTARRVDVTDLVRETTAGVGLTLLRMKSPEALGCKTYII
jgi:hypothetical protein